jgi:hypothetical protein
MKRAAPAQRVRDEVQPWNARQYAYLRAQGKPRLWLVLSEDEAHALAAGVVLARTQSAARKMLEPIGGLG